LTKSHRLTYLLLCLANVFNIYDRQALGALLEPLRREFHLSDTQLGALPTAFTIVYALAGLPLGRLADTWSRKRLLAIGVAVWAGLTGAGALAWSYGALFFTRMGVGVGEAVCAPAATSWIADLVPAARRARAMAGFMMAVPVGLMLSFAITGAVTQAYGWRAALAVAAVPAVVLVPLLLTRQDPPLPSRSASGGHAGALLRIPALWWLAASGALANFILYTFSTFIAAFFSRYHGLSVAQAGLWAGIGSGAAGMLGALAAGALGDRVDRLRLAAWSTALSSVPAAFGLLLQPGSAGIAVLLLMLAYGLLQMYYALVYAAIQDVAPPDLRGTAMAGYYLAMYLGGGSLGPLVAGRLSDYFARQAAGPGASTELARAAGLQHALFVIPALSAVLAAVLWASARSIPARPPESAAHPSR
jgi:predicted MFS family arabinose efflux permease